MKNFEPGRGRFNTFSYQPGLEIRDAKLEPGGPVLGLKRTSGLMLDSTHTVCTYTYKAINCANVQTRVSFESLWHVKCEQSCRESIAQLQRLQWDKNRMKGPKIENRLSKPEEKNKITPISVIGTY